MRSSRNSSPSARVRFATERIDALAPQELVREGRDVAHVDPGADDGAAFAHVAKRGGNELAGGGEDDHRVEIFRRALEGIAGPHGSERARERLRLLVALARACEDPATLGNRNLADDVRGRAEAVQPDPLRVPCEPE